MAESQSPGRRKHRHRSRSRRRHHHRRRHHTEPVQGVQVKEEEDLGPADRPPTGWVGPSRESQAPDWARGASPPTGWVGPSPSVARSASVPPPGWHGRVSAPIRKVGGVTGISPLSPTRREGGAPSTPPRAAAKEELDDSDDSEDEDGEEDVQKRAKAGRAGAAVPPPTSLDNSSKPKHKGKGKGKKPFPEAGGYGYGYGYGYGGGAYDYGWYGEEETPEPPRLHSDSLVLSNVPRELNNVSLLHRHFRNFGEVVKITSDAEQGQACVQFAEEVSAQAARAVAVFENRDIVVNLARKTTSKGGGKGKEGKKGKSKHVRQMPEDEGGEHQHLSYSDEEYHSRPNEEREAMPPPRPVKRKEGEDGQGQGEGEGEVEGEVGGKGKSRFQRPAPGELQEKLQQMKRQRQQDQEQQQQAKPADAAQASNFTPYKPVLQQERPLSQNRVLVNNPEEAARINEEKRRKEELSEKKAQFIMKVTDQMKTIMVKLREEIPEAKKAAYRQRLNKLRDHLQAVSPQPETAPAKGKGKNKKGGRKPWWAQGTEEEQQLQEEGAEEGGEEWQEEEEEPQLDPAYEAELAAKYTLDFRTKIVRVSATMPDFTVDKVKEVLRMVDSRAETVQVIPCDTKDEKGQDTFFAKFATKKLAETVMSLRKQTTFEYAWVATPPPGMEDPEEEEIQRKTPTNSAQEIQSLAEPESEFGTGGSAQPSPGGRSPGSLSQLT